MTQSFSLDFMRRDIATIIHLDPDEIGDEDNLMDLGLDSMRAMNLVVLWQKRGVPLDFSEMALRPTLAGWWQLAARHLDTVLEARS
ncbi:phosphopantetheine-binding protein [Agrobacterium vitis]|uniref:Phosphopantetheine-binding protein n=1 Tax=Agrobacterium vitis TaxID=373 RepID=A0A6I4G8J7_AGRVI|nr:phosphopantetheine-binding protein [Agrobacterium vitis]MBF2714352.1 phosphopantetheine-binding protein [Agrobacterium vitis]MVA22014.1 phosphopantetheine-binding protein [Agrobacterium vitis]MVA59360.1 phosphopantetheine-binding protein [Agrobacterium vitis]MVA82671.1 phosphopantetheine-binding protein [Agrobacterium vitis]